MAQRTEVEPRRRPKKRQAQIAAVAAEAFSERGHHSVSVDDIAATVGISEPALYRHYPNKYAFLTAICTTVANRRTAGLYRWESRYLEATDRASLPPRRLERMLLDACRTVSRVDLPAPTGPDVAPAPKTGIPLSNKREVLLNESIVPSHARGYHEVSIDDIGTAAGRSTTPREALRSLVEVYVRLSFAQSDLMNVYFAEIGRLPDAQRRELRNVPRLNVEEWVHLLGETRSELSAAECRFLVHAALRIVLDVGRVMRFESTPVNEAPVQTMMLATLFGDSSDDTGGSA